MKKVACLLFALVALTATVSAQDQDRLYVRELLRLMEREGWTASETGELERLMVQQRWQWQITPEAEPVAYALGYARQAGLAQDPAATMELAQELALRAAEMRQLGFETRTIARAEIEAVRQTVQAIKAGGTDAPGTQIRDRTRPAADQGHAPRPAARPDPAARGRDAARPHPQRSRCRPARRTRGRPGRRRRPGSRQASVR